MKEFKDKLKKFFKWIFKALSWILIIPVVIIIFYILNNLLFNFSYWGSFLGAFFAFLFLILFEYLKRKYDKKKEIRRNHALLERYFIGVKSFILRNKFLIKSIIENYNKKIIDLDFFINIPIIKNSTIKMKDALFINRMIIYENEIDKLNHEIDVLNKYKEKINLDLEKFSSLERKRGEIGSKNFIQEIKKFENVLNYFLELSDKLEAENKILLKKYKNYKYKDNFIKKELKLRKKEIDKEMELNKRENNDNPFLNEIMELLKKYNLYKEDN